MDEQRKAKRTRRNSATVVLQLLDHVRGMARNDGHLDMAKTLDEAYYQCLRVESAERIARRPSSTRPTHLH